MIRKLLRALQQNLGIGKERYFVGHDLAGNSYYERLPQKGSVSTRPKRFVNFKFHSNDPTMYRNHHLSPQWSSWLSFTRKDPPSIEELQADQLRLARLRNNIRRLELQDQLDSSSQLTFNPDSPTVNNSLPSLSESLHAQDHKAELERKRKKINESPLSVFTLQSETRNSDNNWQPTTWNPRVVSKANHTTESSSPALKDKN